MLHLKHPTRLLFQEKVNGPIEKEHQENNIFSYSDYTLLDTREYKNINVLWTEYKNALGMCKPIPAEMEPSNNLNPQAHIHICRLTTIKGNISI